jgi:hypothetical protein
MYFGIRQHRIRGWTGVQDFDQLANMVIDDFPENPTVPRTRTYAFISHHDRSNNVHLLIPPCSPSAIPAIPFSPVLSVSEQRLFVGLTIPFLYSLEPQTGTVEWELEGNSTPSGPVIVSPDDRLIYLTWVRNFVSL